MSAGHLQLQLHLWHWRDTALCFLPVIPFLHCLQARANAVCFGARKGGGFSFKV